MQLGHISDFVNECNTGSLPCDFVSSHLYPSDPQCGQTKESWDPSCFSRLIKGARAKVPASMEFFVTTVTSVVTHDVWNERSQVSPVHESASSSQNVNSNCRTIEKTTEHKTRWFFYLFFISKPTIAFVPTRTKCPSLWQSH